MFIQHKIFLLIYGIKKYLILIFLEVGKGLISNCYENIIIKIVDLVEVFGIFQDFIKHI